MATLTSNRLSIQIRYDDIRTEQDMRVFYYNVWLRYAGHPLINPVLLKEKSYGSSPCLRLNNSIDELLIPFFQSVLEDDAPHQVSFFESGLKIVSYGRLLWFPPMQPGDFYGTWFDEAEFGKPAENYKLYIEFDVQNMLGETKFQGNGVGITMDVTREELMDFVDDLKAEYAEALSRFEKPAVIVDPWSQVSVAFDPVCRPLEVYFFQGKMTGWIDINLTAGDASVKIDATYVFPPFDDLLNFLVKVAENDLPAVFEIEEEGPTKVLQATHWDDPQADQIRFEVLNPGSPKFVAVIDCLLDRRQCVRAIFNDLSEFYLTHFSKEDWDGDLFTRHDLFDRLGQIVKGWEG